MLRTSFVYPHTPSSHSGNPPMARWRVGDKLPIFLLTEDRDGKFRTARTGIHARQDARTKLETSCSRSDQERHQCLCDARRASIVSHRPRSAQQDRGRQVQVVNHVDSVYLFPCFSRCTQLQADGSTIHGRYALYTMGDNIATLAHFYRACLATGLLKHV